MSNDLTGVVGFERNWFFGMRGFEVLTAGNTYTRPTGWYVVYSDDDSVYSATMAEGDNLPSGTRFEGAAIYGDFRAIVVTSGQLLAYQITSGDTTVVS